MALTADQLNVIYQNVLFRNVDSAGIQFFANRSDISDAQVRQQIELSPEASTFVSPIVRLYQEVLGRVPDQAGLKFFSLQLRGGTSLDNVAQSLISSAEFQAKTTATSGSVDVTDLSNTNQLVSDAFQSILGRTPSSGEFQFFTGKTPAQILSAVAGSSEAANTNAAATVTFLDSVAVGSPNGGTLNSQTGAGGSNAGQIFNLTTGTDTVLGTGGNDTINALVTGGADTTLSAADRIDGGAGTSDILNITVTAASTDVTGGANITNVEGIQIRNITAGADAALDASTVPGLTFINSNISAGSVTVTNAANGTAFGLVGNGSVANGVLNAGYAAAATSGIVTVANGTTGTAGINVTGTGLTSLAINSVGAVNTVGTIAVTPAVKNVTINATTDFSTGGITVGTLGAGGQTLTISGAAADRAATAANFITPAVVLGTLDADFATVTAAGLTAGGISATLSTNFAATVTGGAGNDIITTNGVLTTGSVNAGGGSFDRLVVANTADLATTALGAKFTGFEQIQANNGVSVNLDNISGINTVLLNDGASNATALTNLSAAQASSVVVLASAGASIIDVKGATNAGQVDTVGLIFNNGNTTLNETGTNSTFTLTGVETLNVTAVDGANITESAATAGSLTAVNLSGAGDISFTTGNIATSNFNINASAATGNVTVNASAFANNGVTITGGTGTNTLTGSGQNDVINAGTGKNTITGGVGADSITLNTGADKVVYTTSGDSVATTPATTLDTVTNFTAGTDKFIVGTGGAAALPTALVQGAAFTAAGTGTLATDITSALTAGGQNAATLAVGTAAVVTITGTGAGTYLVYNDTAAGYQTTDTVVKLAGLSGTLALTDFATA